MDTALKISTIQNPKLEEGEYVYFMRHLHYQPEKRIAMPIQESQYNCNSLCSNNV
jgi:hypothetical protein